MNTTIHNARMLVRSTMVAGALLATLCAAAQQPELKARSERTVTIAASVRDNRTGGQPASTMGAPTITHRVIDAPNGTYGYEILVDGKLFVRQTTVPGRSGVEGCPARQQAEALAALVESKMLSGAMPPSVSAEELVSLGL